MRGPLFLVADGMGGAAAGEIASTMCTEAFAEINLIRLRGADALRSAVSSANASIYERAQANPELAGMGTTVIAALVDEDAVVTFAHVGDSRAYLMREGVLRRLSEDHSVVAELVASGHLTEEEAVSHPQRSVITRVLGAEPNVEVDTFTIDGAAGDVVLLCSDGLTGMVGGRADRRAAGRRRARRGDHPQPGARGAGGRRRGQHHGHRVPPGRARRPADRLDAADPDDRPRPAPAGRRVGLVASRPQDPVRRHRHDRRGRGAGGGRGDRPAPEPLHRRQRVHRQSRDLPGRAMGAVRRHQALPRRRASPRSPTPPSIRRPARTCSITACAPNRMQRPRSSGSRRALREKRPHPRAVEPAVGRPAHRHRLPGRLHGARSRRSRAHRWSTRGSSSRSTRSPTSACGPDCLTPTPGCCRWPP